MWACDGVAGLCGEMWACEEVAGLCREMACEGVAGL